MFMRTAFGTSERENRSSSYAWCHSSWQGRNRMVSPQRSQEHRRSMTRSKLNIIKKCSL
jgi:hypothetical protein